MLCDRSRCDRGRTAATRGARQGCLCAYSHVAATRRWSCPSSGAPGVRRCLCLFFFVFFFFVFLFLFLFLFLFPFLVLLLFFRTRWLVPPARPLALAGRAQR